MGLFFDSIIESLVLIGTFDKETVLITLLSLKVSLFAVFLSALIGVPIALLISNNEFYGKRVLISLIHTAMAVPPVVVGLLVFLSLSRNGFLGGLDILYTPFAMIIAQMLMAIPIIIGVSLSAFNGVLKKTKNLIISLGANKIQFAIKIIQQAKFGLITALVTAFGAAISEVGAIILVGGNIKYHTRALTTAIVLETRRGNFSQAIALGIILIGLAFLINFILTYAQQRGVKEFA